MRSGIITMLKSFASDGTPLAIRCTVWPDPAGRLCLSAASKPHHSKHWRLNTFATDLKKPVITYIAGASATAGRNLGHAGAIISAFGDRGDEKTGMLREVGATIAEDPASIGSTVANCPRALQINRVCRSRP